MRVAQVCPRYWPYIGGVEVHVEDVSTELAKRGFEVEVLTTYSSDDMLVEDEQKAIKIKRFKSYAPRESYHFSSELNRYLYDYSNDYDIVHAHSYHGFPAFYAARAKDKNRFVFTPHYHGSGHTLFRSLLHKPYKLFGKSIFEKADFVICVSDYEKGLVLENFEINTEKIKVIPNGVNLEEFKSLRKKKRDYRTILYVGRLEKYKGVQYILMAMSKLDHDIFFEIVGSGPYEKRLLELAQQLGIENRVKFFKNLPRPQLLQKYADADLFVLLSAHEAFGLSTAESLAARTPCILAKTSGLVEWIDNKNCFGVNFPINIDELVVLINEVIGKKLGEVNLWDWKKVVDSLTKVYESIVEI